MKYNSAASQEAIENELTAGAHRTVRIVLDVKSVIYCGRNSRMELEMDNDIVRKLQVQ